MSLRVAGWSLKDKFYDSIRKYAKSIIKLQTKNQFEETKELMIMLSEPQTEESKECECYYFGNFLLQGLFMFSKFLIFHQGTTP